MGDTGILDTSDLDETRTVLLLIEIVGCEKRP
jgi:hypothetical protein